MTKYSKELTHRHRKRTMMTRNMGRIFATGLAHYNNIHFPSYALLKYKSSKRLLYFKSSVNTIDCFMEELLLHTKTLIIRNVDR